MSERPDWDSWILQKNAEVKAEELKKSDSVVLEKKVNPEAIGSRNVWQGSATGEGDAKPRKWQGSDPRHISSLNAKHKGVGHTRAGNQVEFGHVSRELTPKGSKPKMATTGVSLKGYSRVETGKPVKMVKDEDSTVGPKRNPAEFGKEETCPHCGK